jgi:hypothetical protein
MKKTIAIILMAIIAMSTISFVSAAYARGPPFMQWRNLPKMPGNSQEGSHEAATQQNFVRFNGFINQSGSINATGTIEAQSRTIILDDTSSRQGSSAKAMWTTNTSRPISGFRDKENFTYTFYTASLTNVNVSSLNENGYGFFLNGTWNVYNVTSIFTVNTDSSGNIISFKSSKDGVALASNAYGELKVSSNGGNFTLSINGVDPLTGPVHVQRTTTRMFNPFKVLDDDGMSTVTEADMSSVMRAFGSSPGWGNYDQRMDYNFNYKVDICDLATVAANINS